MLTKTINSWYVSVVILCAASGCANDGRAKAAMDAPTTMPSAEQTVHKVRDRDLNRLAVTAGGQVQGLRDRKLEVVYVFDGPPLPTGLAGTADGRDFVCFPRWGEATNYTAAEVTGGKLVPFPDAETNQFLPSDPQEFDPRTHLVSVQSVVVDPKGRLWLLDTGSINLQPPLAGGPKLWGYDLKTRQRVAAIDFSNGDAIKPKTYLNDVRFDLSRGEAGYAYLTDSGEGGLVVVDLATGRAWRKLDGHPSTAVNKEITIVVEGDPLKVRPPNSDEAKNPPFAADGIALSPDGKTLYYTSLSQRDVFAVPTDVLADESADAAAAVQIVASKQSCNDGLACDDKGRIYSTDYESNAIRVIDPAAQTTPDSSGVAKPAARVLVRDERILWPDSIFVRDGFVYFTSNQLNRQGQFHRGQSLLKRPFVVFRYPADGAAAIKPR